GRGVARQKKGDTAGAEADIAAAAAIRANVAASFVRYGVKGGAAVTAKAFWLSCPDGPQHAVEERALQLRGRRRLPDFSRRPLHVALQRTKLSQEVGEVGPVECHAVVGFWDALRSRFGPFGRARMNCFERLSLVLRLQRRARLHAEQL